MTQKASPAKKTTAKKTAQKKSSSRQNSVSKEQKQAQALAEKRKRVEEIIDRIESQAVSLYKSLKISQMSSRTFYEVLDETPELQKSYARACEIRAEIVFDEILDIADDNRGDTITIRDKNGNPIEVEDKEWTSRSKLRVDARKWYLAKMRPEKYGDKLEIDQKSDVTVSFKGGE